MQIYHLQDFIGEFERNHISPNTYYSAPMDLSIVLRVRANPKVGQTKYYLVYRYGKGKSHYLTALWNSTATSSKGLNEFVMTDTQGVRGIVQLDLYSLRIKKAKQ